MVNYQLGKIYKILDNTNGNIYIGSTCESKLSQRLAEHVSNYKKYKKNTYHYVSSFDVLQNNNYNIFLLENYPCNNSDELRTRERFYIETNKCVNLYNPIRTVEETQKYKHELYILNKDKYQENYSQNSEEIKKYNKLRRDSNKNIEIICECGCVFNKNTKLNRHKQTKKHINLMKESLL